jgi:transport and Golgi organization protein 2
MCTVTFIPHREGYRLGMNRDERTSRAIASPPAVFRHRGIDSIYPRDAEGGTWIAANGWGIAFTLLNWNDTEALQAKVHSRGSVIPVLIDSTDSQAAQFALCKFRLEGVLPFTLLGFFPDEEVLLLWRWNQNSLESEFISWELRQWCSSSLSDTQASQRRGTTLALALRESDTGSRRWLRKLHGSHVPGDRPFSTCVHRGDVETVSYSELTCTDRRVECDYVVGSPCAVGASAHRVSITRSPLSPN